MSHVKKIELANIFADMMIQFRRMEGFSEEFLWENAYNHINRKLDEFIDSTNQIPVTDLTSFSLDIQKTNLN